MISESKFPKPALEDFFEGEIERVFSVCLPQDLHLGCVDDLKPGTWEVEHFSRDKDRAEDYAKKVQGDIHYRDIDRRSGQEIGGGIYRFNRDEVVQIKIFPEAR